MRATNEPIDLYTLWKRDEELREHPTPPSMNAIPVRTDTSRFLVPTVGQVIYTDGYTSLKQDDRYERTLFDEEMEVPSIGTEKKNFDLAETITFDILGASTRLPLMCKMIIYQQGATHEREPPILVRDVCIQWDGVDRPRSNSVDSLSVNSMSRYANNLQRARSSDYLLDNTNGSVAGRPLYETNRCLSISSSMTEDDDAASIVTAGGTVHHRVSHILHRHRYRRQIDANLVGRTEFYSVPFYQYRGRRYGQKDVALQVNGPSIESTVDVEPEIYSVTMILPVRDRRQTATSSAKDSNLFQASIPVNSSLKHTTIGYTKTRQYVTIQRTLHGHPIDA